MVFTDAGLVHNKPGKIATLGVFYPQTDAGTALSVLREHKSHYGAASGDQERIQVGLAWTQTINALNRGRRWALRDCFARLDSLLAAGIAITVVPSHAAYVVDTPIRELAQLLAASQDRIDATECLERHTGIRQILFGGPSTRALHHQTIHVLNPERFHDRPVLLLDDIAKSGASLVACRELIQEAGATPVQALALARVVTSEQQPSSRH
jgi:hypothetical protein